MRQQSHSSLPCTTLCHLEVCLSGWQTCGDCQRTQLSDQPDIPYALLRINYLVQAAFQSNIWQHQNISDCVASSILHCSLFEDLVRVCILPSYNHELVCFYIWARMTWSDKSMHPLLHHFQTYLEVPVFYKQTKLVLVWELVKWNNSNIKVLAHNDCFQKISLLCTVLFLH